MIARSLRTLSLDLCRWSLKCICSVRVRFTSVEVGTVLACLLGTNESWGIAIARIALGVVFFAHGGQKLFGWFGGHGLKNTLRSFREGVGIPEPLAVLAIATEFLGGVGLIFGFLSRLAALGIAVTMIVAILTVHGKFGFFMNWYGEKRGHGVEYHILVLALALVVLLNGAGAFSLDQAVYRHIETKNGGALGAAARR